MIDASALLAVARSLVVGQDGQSPSEEQLRRAASTAYYAIFHHVLHAGAIRFAGSGSEHQPAYAIIYRAYSHGRMKSDCKSLNVVKLSDSYQSYLQTTSVSQQARDFCQLFITLQDLRHRADYDPASRFRAGVAYFPDMADQAMELFDAIPEQEQRNILALMLVTARE